MTTTQAPDLWLRSRCDIAFEIEAPTPFILMLRPRSSSQQWIARESYTLSPHVPVQEYTDAYGNLCQRLIAPAGDFSISTSADILTAKAATVCPGAPYIPVQDLPDNVLQYLLPSRYCESDRFIELAHSLVDGITPGYDQVAALVAWIQTSIRFNPDSPHFQLSAVEIHQHGEGVCREMAHLAIALCRGLCIPARMVVGYLHQLQPMDFHAWFEAYVGGHWIAFDPTQTTPKGGRVAVAYGRDAADVAIFTQFGPATYPTQLRVSVEALDTAPN
jgi:transglutaminase-like putative cysteine protease